MGGFRINGCGATDHFKKIKSLGFYECSGCRKVTEFFLEEAKFKIDIFFIPTVTLKSRYAVMCGRCENGEFCSDEWASRLMNEGNDHSVIFESESFQRVTVHPELQDSSAVQQTSQPLLTERTVSEQAVDPSRNNNIPTFFKCEYCGVTQLREGKFCSFCGKPAPAEPDEQKQTSTAAASGGAESVCPGCGAKVGNDMAFCTECGKRL